MEGFTIVGLKHYYYCCILEKVFKGKIYKLGMTNHIT